MKNILSSLRKLVLPVILVGVFTFSSAQNIDTEEVSKDSLIGTGISWGVEFGYGDFMSLKGDSNPYKSQFELGILFQFNTLLSKKDPRWRIDYGVNIEGRMTGIKNNQILIDENDETILQDFPHKLKRSTFETVNILFPLHLEFGHAPKIKSEGEDAYYSFNEKFKGGIGGFLGFKLFSSMNYKYDKDGKFDNVTHHRSYNTENFLYGLSGYVQYDFIRLYSRFNLNEMFKAAEVNGQSFVLGVAFLID